MDDEEAITALMQDYNLTRAQAEEALALRDNPTGDVIIVSDPAQAPDTKR